MQCWGLLGAMGSPAGALARGLRRDAPAPGVAGADIVVVGVLRYEVVDAEAGALAPVIFAIAAAALSCAVALRAGILTNLKITNLTPLITMRRQTVTLADA